MQNFQAPFSPGDGLLPTLTDQSVFQKSNQTSFQQSNTGRGCGRGYGNSKMQCQLCGKFNYLVHRCYHRFNVNFTCVTDPSSHQKTGSAHLTSANCDDVDFDHSSYATRPVPLHMCHS